MLLVASAVCYHDMLSYWSLMWDFVKYNLEIHVGYCMHGDPSSSHLITSSKHIKCVGPDHAEKDGFINVYLLRKSTIMISNYSFQYFTNY